MKSLLLVALAFFATPVLPQSFDRAAGIIGILTLPEVFGVAPCERFEPKEIPVFRSPETGRTFGKIHVAQNWRFPKEGGCEGLVVRVSAADAPARADELPAMEFAYEQPGAIVVRRIDPWFEIALSEGTGWVRVPEAERFLPVERMLRDGLTYLRKGGEVPLRAVPGDPAGTRAAVSRTALDLPVRVLAFRRVSDVLWVQIELLGANPCSDEKLPVAPPPGWIPFHDAKGEPTVWFSSRGC